MTSLSRRLSLCMYVCNVLWLRVSTEYVVTYVQRYQCVFILGFCSHLTLGAPQGIALLTSLMNFTSSDQYFQY